MAQGLPTSLARPIFHSIDYVEAVTAVRMEVTSDVPTLARFGFRGGIGVARGQAPFMVTLTFAGTAEKDQFELLAKQQSQRNGDGFTWDFWEGDKGMSSHWACRKCVIGRWTMTNDPATGITDKTISFISINAEQLQ